MKPSTFDFRGVLFCTPPFSIGDYQRQPDQTSGKNRIATRANPWATRHYAEHERRSVRSHNDSSKNVLIVGAPTTSRSLEVMNAWVSTPNTIGSAVHKSFERSAIPIGLVSAPLLESKARVPS